MHKAPNKLAVVFAVIASLLGLVASVITINASVMPDQSILEWFSLETLEAANAWLKPALEQWPLGPFLSAVLIFAVVAIVVFFADVVDEFGPYIGILFLFLPLPGLWVLLFWDVPSVAGLWTYAAAYVVVPWAVVFIPDIIYYELWDRADRRTALVGKISAVDKTVRELFGREIFDYEFVLDRQDDIQAKVKYSQGLLFTKPRKGFPKAGAYVRIHGHWGADGVFQAAEICKVNNAEATG